MIGGLLYYAPLATIAFAWKIPLTCVKTTVEMAGNSAMIVYDTCRLAQMLSKKAIYQVIKIKDERYALPCKSTLEEFGQDGDLAASLKSFSVINESELLLDDWVIIE